MAGYSVARCVNYCKCMENYQFFSEVIRRHVTHARGVCLGRSAVLRVFY